MSAISLYIDSTNGTIVQSQTSFSAVDPNSLQLYYGDSPTVNIYLLQRNYVQGMSNWTYSTFQAPGAVAMFLDDGTANGTTYASQTSFTYANGYYSASLALNTTQLQTLIGSGTVASVWIKIGCFVAGVPITYYSGTTMIEVGLPTTNIVTLPGQTALSVQAANQLYFPQTPVAGMPLFIKSPNGKTLAITAIDNADGTVSPQWALWN